MVLGQEKTIRFDHVKQIAMRLHSVLQTLRPDRWIAICAMIELAIATLKHNEPLKHDLEACYKKHVKPAAKSNIVLPPGGLS